MTQDKQIRCARPDVKRLMIHSDVIGDAATSKPTMVDDLSLIRRTQEVPVKQGEKSEFYNLGYQMEARAAIKRIITHIFNQPYSLALFHWTHCITTSDYISTDFPSLTTSG